MRCGHHGVCNCRPQLSLQCLNAAVQRLLVLIFIIGIPCGPKVLATSISRAGRDVRSGQDVLGERLTAKRCVFILSTGRAGSTALMDALNQVPSYLIRGENWRAIGSLHWAYSRLRTLSKEPGQEVFDWENNPAKGFWSVKARYEAQANQSKLIFFNEFREQRVMLASRVYYAVLFNHFGPDVVSGFKEIRFVCGHFFRSAQCAEDFHDFMAFLTRLCLDVKVVFNTRRSSSLDDNHKVLTMDETITDNGRQFAADLSLTHLLYDGYAAHHPRTTFRMFFEDMFDPQTNVTLATRLLNFLGVDPRLNISFSRMPSWSISQGS